MEPQAGDAKYPANTANKNGPNFRMRIWQTVGGDRTPQPSSCRTSAVIAYTQ